MEPFCSEREMVELLMRIYGSPALAPDIRADAAYLFAQMPDFTDSVVYRAGHTLWEEGHVKNIAICGIEAMSGFVGFTAWRDKIRKVASLRHIPEKISFPYLFRLQPNSRIPTLRPSGS